MHGTHSLGRGRGSAASSVAGQGSARATTATTQGKGIVGGGHGTSRTGATNLPLGQGRGSAPLASGRGGSASTTISSRGGASHASKPRELHESDVGSCNLRGGLEGLVNARVQVRVGRYQFLSLGF